MPAKSTSQTQTKMAKRTHKKSQQSNSSSNESYDNDVGDNDFCLQMDEATMTTKYFKALPTAEKFLIKSIIKIDASL